MTLVPFEESSELGVIEEHIQIGFVLLAYELAESRDIIEVSFSNEEITDDA